MTTNTVYDNGQSYIVHSTMNHEQFRLFEENRPIDPEHVARLYDAISRKNLLRDYPIMVTQDMKILDGQHRWAAAKALNTPIFFIYSRDATIDDIAEAVGNVRDWTVWDYLRRYKLAGNLHYIRLERFVQRYPFLKLTTARDLCYYGDKFGMAGKFKSGLYEFNDSEFGEMVAERLLDLKRFVPHWDHSYLIVAMSNLSANVDYDHTRFLQKLEYQSRRLVKCPDTDTYIAVINDIYNYRTKEEQKVQLKKLGTHSPKYRTDRKRL